MTRRDVLVAGTAGILGTLAGCGKAAGDSFEAIRYRLQATVNTPTGEKTGFSIIQVQWAMAAEWASKMGGGSSYNIKGEAFAVDVAPGQAMFVLIASETDVDWAAWATGVVPDSTDQGGALGHDAKVARGRDRIAQIRADRDVHQLWDPKAKNREEAIKYLPYFVRFRDVRDPTSVERVDPYDLAKSFGRGVSLKALTLQVTDEPTTSGIELRLPWLPMHNGALLRPPSDQPIARTPLTGRINEGSFWQGMRK